MTTPDTPFPEQEANPEALVERKNISTAEIIELANRHPGWEIHAALDTQGIAKQAKKVKAGDVDYGVGEVYQLRAPLDAEQWQAFVERYGKGFMDDIFSEIQAGGQLGPEAEDHAKSIFKVGGDYPMLELNLSGSADQQRLEDVIDRTIKALDARGIQIDGHTD